MEASFPLETYLKELHLPAMLQNYQALAQEATREHLSYERYLWALAQAEMTRRDTQRVNRLILEAHFPVRKELADFDFTVVESLSKSRVCELAEGGYVTACQSVLLVGNPGLGKSHIATGLALTACRQGHRVRFTTVAGVVNDLLVAQQELRLSRVLQTFTKFDVLVLDEFGFVPLSPAGAQLLFQLISTVYERVALIVTTNLRFGEWTSVLGDPMLTAALLDRVTHKAHILEFRGESYRFRRRLQPEIPDGLPPEESASPPDSSQNG